MEIAELKKQIAPSVIFSGSEIKNPVTCEVTLWDKKSENKIKVSIDLDIK